MNKGKIQFAGIMMADLVGYTRFCESSDLLAIRDIVRKIHKTTISTIKNWDGSIVNIMGDSIMAAFPEEEFDKPVWSAVSAGCLILNRIRKMKVKHKIKPSMHAGVDWGKVWIGRITDKPVFGSLTVLGPPVNRAARYQALARPNEIVLPWSDEVQAMLEEGDVFLPGMRYKRDKEKVRGIGKINLARVRLSK